MKRDAKFARELDELDARRDRGDLTPNQYDVQRARLMKEAEKRPWHWGVQLAVIVGILVAFLLVLRVAGAFVNAVGS